MIEHAGMTEKSHNPTDVARETLKQLAARRIAPTPDRYEEIYYEIAGGAPGSGNPTQELVREFVGILKAMPMHTPELTRQISLIENAAVMRDWAVVPTAVVQAIEAQGGQANLTRAWAELIRDLITQWELRSPHFTAARKQESLSKVLLNFGNYPNLLNEKLAALIASWAEGAGSGSHIDVLEAAAPVAGATAEAPAGTAVVPPTMDWQRWRELLVRSLRVGVADRLPGFPELAEEATSLAQAAEAVSSAQGLDFLAGRLKKFWIHLELRSEREGRITTGLVNLLLLLSDNMVAISSADDWVKGQVAVIRDLLSQPLSINRLYEVEAAFKEIVDKQSALKQGLDDAQATLKGMVTMFIDRLSSMVDSTSGYSSKIEDYAGRLQQTRGIGELQGLINELMQDTRVMQLDMTRSRDELLLFKAKAEEADQRVMELEHQLRLVSEKIREDQLTGALNRRGFKESFDTELARLERSGKPLCVALLDIDNFKKLNDQRGHQVGDDALVHMVKVVKDILRPTDIIARYGGEEFVVLLPETVLTEAASVMRRVQRELTKRFFLHNNDRLLITFSAGVTRYVPGESQEEAIERADHAMYEAKKAGKNQVIVAETPKHKE
jgi:diguanylate cyclase